MKNYLGKIKMLLSIRNNVFVFIYLFLEANNLFFMATWSSSQFCSSMIIVNFIMAPSSSQCQLYCLSKLYNLSNHTTFHLKTSGKEQNNFYSSHSIWIVQIRLGIQKSRRHLMSVQSLPIWSTITYKFYVESYLQPKGNIQDFFLGNLFGLLH